MSVRVSAEIPSSQQNAIRLKCGQKRDGADFTVAIDQQQLQLADHQDHQAMSVSGHFGRYSGVTAKPRDNSCSIVEPPRRQPSITESICRH